MTEDEIIETIERNGYTLEDGTSIVSDFVAGGRMRVIDEEGDAVFECETWDNLEEWVGAELF